MDKYSLSFLIFPKGDTMNKYALLLALPLTAAGIAGCASDIDSNYYSTGSVGQVSQAQGCTVVSVRPIKVSTQNGAGTAIGGIAGGIAGSQIGGGNTAMDAARAAKRVPGASVGGGRRCHSRRFCRQCGTGRADLTAGIRIYCPAG